MARLANTPRQQLTLDLERRKSYTFRCVLLNADRTPLDLTGCKLRFVMKKPEYDFDDYDINNEIVHSEARIDSPESGEATFAFQAAELDGTPGAYNYVIVLWTADGFSVVVLKGQVNLMPNPESLSMSKSYTANTAGAALELTMRSNDVINLVVNTLTRSTVRADIIGTGRPDDASTLEATTMLDVQIAVPGTLFISLDGSGQGMWAWRLRRTGWALIEGIGWADLPGKPAEFPPIYHQHLWADIIDRPLTMPPAPHTHLWAQIIDKPATFPPSAHQQPWADVSGKPTTFPPSLHSHSWADTTGKPTTFPPAVHTHDWAAVTGKPATFPPSAHRHDASDIDGYIPGSGGGDWASITGKPTTFPPSAHNQDWSTITGKPAFLGAGASAAAARSAIDAAPTTHTHLWAQITDKPATFPPEPHTQPWANVSGIPTTFAPAPHTHTKGEVGLGSVDNTSDMAKPVSTATTNVLNLRAKAALAAPGTFWGVWAAGSAPTPTGVGPHWGIETP